MSKIKRHIFGSSIDLGLLVLRIGIGLQFILHGWPKITGGSEKWMNLGESMSLLGMDHFPTFWGFMAAFAEFGGGVLILIGWLTRPSAFLLAFTMLVASLVHWAEDDSKWMSASHSLELMIVFIALYLTGPGRYSVDEKLHR